MKNKDARDTLYKCHTLHPEVCYKTSISQCREGMVRRQLYIFYHNIVGDVWNTWKKRIPILSELNKLFPIPKAGSIKQK